MAKLGPPGNDRVVLRPFPDSAEPAPFGPALWVIVSATWSCAGWILSAFHQLTPIAYALVLAFLLAGLFWWERSRDFSDLQSFKFRRMARRLQRPLPLGFLLLTVLAVLGGMLYAPNNFDALSYRIPRVMNWLVEHRWHWIHSAYIRLNDRATGTEWLLAPGLALTGSVRWFFVTNIVSFCLMPGLIYSVLTRFGVNRKVAWRWMWIIPTGYGFATQAGSAGNDLLGVVYVLIAFDFALRVRNGGRLRDFWFFLVASALTGGSKPSNLPLLLPLFLIVCPRWKMLFLRPAKTALISLICAIVSFLPTAILNQHYCQDWTGMRLEGPMKSPPVQLFLNSSVFLIQNLAPPIFPFANAWNRFSAGLLPPEYELNVHFKVLELQAEETAGLGMGICLLVIISLTASYLIRRRKSDSITNRPKTAFEKITLWSAYLALLAFAIKSQPGAMVARLITPYYVLLLAPLLVYGFNERLLYYRWWKGLVALVFALAVVVVVLSPARPLWPASTLLASFRSAYPDSKLIERAQLVYGVYGRRSNVFAPVLAQLPRDLKILGFITFDDPETSLWWPWGSRRIQHIMPADTRDNLDAMGITYVLASSSSDPYRAIVEPDGTLDILLQKYRAERVATFSLRVHANAGLEDYYLVKLKP